MLLTEYNNKEVIHVRLEHDFLGEVQVPDDVYYGVQTVRAVNNFNITGHKMDTDFIVALATVKKAAVAANRKARVNCMSPQVGDAMLQAADEIIKGKWHEQFVVDCIQGGAGTSMNMNTNEVIANRALEILGAQKGNYEFVSPNNHVNMSQSTNDVIPTAIRITTVRKGKRLVQELISLAEAFEGKAREFSRVLKMGRTHLQDAVPITLGQEFAAYAVAVRRAARRIEKSLESMLTVNMGATAVGTGLNADPVYIEEVVKQIAMLTDESFVSPADLVDATQMTDDVAAVSSTIKVGALALTKICNDLRLMASGPRCGLYEIMLPARQPGSSIMPGKVNPVIPEVVNQTAFFVMGNDLTISLAVENGQFELNVMEPVMAYALFNSFNCLTNAVHTLHHHCVDGILANVGRCHEMVDRSIGIVTALSPHIGYEQSAAIAKEALTTGKPVRQIIADKGLMPVEQIDIILSPEEMTKPGIAGKQFLQCEIK